MTITKKKLSYGRYEVLRDGLQVAVVEKIVDTGEPIWSLTILDGTKPHTMSSGRPSSMDNFKTLADAVRYYGRRVEAEK